MSGCVDDKPRGPIYGVESLEAVMKEYAESEDRLTEGECRDIGFKEPACNALTTSLGYGVAGKITTDEEKNLLKFFSSEFVNGLKRNALERRVRWLADHLNTRSLRWDFNLTSRRKMVTELGDIGPAARTAIPALIEGMKEEDLNETSVALAKIGPDSVPSLVTALETGDWKIRERAAIALGEIGPAAAASVPALIKALEDGQSSGAAEALGKIGPAARVAIPALVEAEVFGLAESERDTSEYYSLRFEAGQALEKIGPATQAEVSALIRALHDNPKGAAKALGEIGPAARDAVVPLADLLRSQNGGEVDSNWDARWEILRALEEIGPAAKAAIPQLIEVVEGAAFSDVLSLKGSFGEKAASLLGEFGPEARSAAPALIKALLSSFRETAASALREIGVGKDEIVHALIDFTRDASRFPSFIRPQICAAMGELGKDASPAIPVLEQIAKGGDPDRRTRDAAAEALEKIKRFSSK